MRGYIHKLKRHVAVVCATAARSGAIAALACGFSLSPAAAQSPAPMVSDAAEAETPEARLDALLAELAAASPEAAGRIERRIMRLWSRSGSAAMDLLLERGRDALEEGKTDTAIAHLTALTDHAPDFAEGFTLRATAYFRKDLYGPALEDLARALSLNPQHFGAWFGLGVILTELDRPEAAQAAFDKVVEIHPHFSELPDALDRLAREEIEQTL